MESTIENQSTDSKKSLRFESDLEEEAEEPKNYKSIDDEIPDTFTGYGLTSTIGCFFFNLILGVPTLRGNKYHYAAIGGLAFGSGLLFAPFINFIVGKIGVRVTISIGTLIYFAGDFMASFAVNLWEIYMTQGVLAGIGMSLICVPSINILPQWFKGGKGGKRNLAMGIQAAGSVWHVLQNQSFRWSLRAQAIMCFGINICCILMVRTRNANIKPVYKVYDHQIWTSIASLGLSLWIVFTSLGYIILMYNLGDFTRSLGYSAHQGSVVSSMVAVGIIYGRPIVGYVGDKIGPINVTMLASWLVSLFSLAMWIPCRNYATAIVFAMFVGSLMGTMWLTIATISAHIVGMRKVGISMALNWIIAAIFGIAAPIIGISLKKDGPDSPTQYQPASIFVGLSYFMAGFSLFLLRAWLITRNKILETEEHDDDDFLNVHVDSKSVMQNIFSMSRV
ncbi:hypothetical protein CAS74_004292 [Pichia kudriavzevii]|uniref:Major facilitator superfamily (MFS) profile domain-containing protein n=1 Tax=Pichia kudriavzevii TaxID=4909 RepID=A0A1Z8JJ73_PICKU|nr:hypothetical protein CAS74_004292 [Pichia kudriavzevii]